MTRPLIGVDLVPLSRVRDLLGPGTGTATGTDPGARSGPDPGPHPVPDPDPGPLLGRFLSAEELAASRTPDGAPDPSGIAGRLAAKEAVFKLLGSVGRPVPWQGIEVLRGPGGRPGVRLSGRAAELARTAGVGPIDVSISHDAGFAIAVAATTTSAQDRPAQDRSVLDRPVQDRPAQDRPVPLDQ
ncbi:4'-phosphopantetheinyl transferase superfamily protein [Streptomyces sp. NPDC057325]|uniref:4'-phosphopantetheinyl transferase superfamily protein n=1 Tax=unclassified Streptomyces TaxID=2593676 RepID=UPI0036449431